MITGAPSSERSQAPPVGSWLDYAKRQGDSSNLLCGICGRIMANSWSFKLHLQTHSSYKPYKCNWCDYASHRKDTLKAHMKAKHKEYYRDVQTP